MSHVQSLNILLQKYEEDKNKFNGIISDLNNVGAIVLLDGFEGFFKSADALKEISEKIVAAGPDFIKNDENKKLIEKTLKSFGAIIENFDKYLVDMNNQKNKVIEKIKV